MTFKLLTSNLGQYSTYLDFYGVLSQSSFSLIYNIVTIHTLFLFNIDFRNKEWNYVPYIVFLSIYIFSDTLIKNFTNLKITDFSEERNYFILPAAILLPILTRIDESVTLNEDTDPVEKEKQNFIWLCSTSLVIGGAIYLTRQVLKKWRPLGPLFWL